MRPLFFRSSLASILPIPLHCFTAALGLCWLLALPLSSAGAVLEEVIDLVAENTELSIGMDGQMWSQGTSDGLLTVVVRENAGFTLFQIYRLDPGTGSSSKIATIDPTIVEPNPNGYLPILGLDGEVYLMIESVDVPALQELSVQQDLPVQQLAAIGAQQDLYRLDGQALTPVLDLTAQGIQLPLFSAEIWSGASSDGVLRVAHRVDFTNQFRVVEINPIVPSAAVVSNLQTTSDFPWALPAFAPDGTVYFLIEEFVMGPPDELTQKLFRVDGDSFVELADIAQAGFRLRLDSMSISRASVTGSGVVRVLSQAYSQGYASLLEIDPTGGSTVLLTSVNPASAYPEPGIMMFLPESESVLGFDGTSYFVVGVDDMESSRQGLFENHFVTIVPRVIDITAQGVEVDTSAAYSGFPTGVALDDTISASVPHPSSMDLERLHRFDPVDGLASSPVTVDLGETGPTVFASAATFGPNGEVYYLVTDGDIEPQQGIWRLDGGALTEVVDLTAEGIELTFPPNGPPPFGAAADGTLRTLTPLSADPDIWKLHRMDPSDGSAVPDATLDLSTVVSTPTEPRSVAFGPAGEPYLVLFDFAAGPPDRQGVYHVRQDSLALLSDLTAQGIELSGGGGPNTFRSAVTTDGRLLVMSGDFNDSSIQKVYAVDTGSGAAALQSIVDVEVFVCCGAANGGTVSTPAFAPDGDVFLIATGEAAAFEPQQMVYEIRQVPEPAATALGLSALAMMAFLGRLRSRMTDGELD